MAELFLRDDFLPPAVVDRSSAVALLDWAHKEAQQAPSEQIYRQREGRTTLRFALAGHSYFLKLHRGIGWAEVLKNLLQLRLPVTGASNEYRAVAALQRLGVDTLSVAAYARRGWNPATQQSLLVTDDLVGTTSLEDYCADWATQRPEVSVRHRLLRKVARSARVMHSAGINHRDFYLCHFHLDESSLTASQMRCYLIDLHRAQLRTATPRRWRVKDLAGLYFSAMDCGLTPRDLLRFMRDYTDGGLRQALGADRRLWQRVDSKARQLYRRTHAADPPPMALLQEVMDER